MNILLNTPMFSTSTPIVVHTLLVYIFSYLCLTPLSNANNGFATWYGGESGAESGGACGWGEDVNSPPLKSMIAAGNADIFLKGKGCGHCFQVFCTRPPYCTGKPIGVTISNECPGKCDKVPFHFDLSGLAFGAMANPGQEHNLRQLGQVDIQYKRVPCNYGATKIAFKINEKNNPNWFAVAIEYVNGDGGFRSVEMASNVNKTFSPMDNIWGAVWKKDIPETFKSPYSFRLTSTDGKTIVASNVIPEMFKNGQKYSSNVNF